MSDGDSPCTESQDGVSTADQDVVETRPQDVLEIEKESLRHLMNLVKKLTPHMEESLILDERWWKNNRFRPGIHVSVALTVGWVTNT